MTHKSLCMGRGIVCRGAYILWIRKRVAIVKFTEGIVSCADLGHNDKLSVAFITMHTVCMVIGD